MRAGIGFNKTPLEYGAFPTDPYSHTPKHGGAKQPGMTGQVKEEVLSRFGELGVRVHDGQVSFEPRLLRPREFVENERSFCFLDVNNQWQDLDVPKRGLAFTWCQVPIVYELSSEAEPQLTIEWDTGEKQTYDQLALSAETSRELFERSGRIQKISARVSEQQLFAG